MSLAFVPLASVHGVVAQHLIYIRRSYRQATAADVSDEMQEAACRKLLPAGAQVRVISDSGGHQSGYTAQRDGYRALLAALAAGEVTAIAVYDLSRLARNARLMLDLHHELERRQVALLVANMPGANFDGATERYMFGQFCLAAQLQRDLDSERMVRMQRGLFEAGRHRGHDPLGYRSERDAAGQLVHPRQLEIDPAEAAIVRRVWAEVRQHSYTDAAERLNLNGVPHRGPWTRDAVKDIIRRGRVYLGNVVEKRGRDERPGQHEAILTEAEVRATLAAVQERTLTGRKPKPYRHYLLRGLIQCACGTRMRGEAHVQRGTEIRYYRCPAGACHSRRSRADRVEQDVLDAIGEAILPPSVIEAGREELRRRVTIPQVIVSGRQRARLQTRLERLRQQHAWGDLTDEAYKAQRDQVNATLKNLPDDDRIRSFDAYRTQLLALRQAIAVASPERLEELCHMVVAQVVVHDREIAAVEWTAPTRPFFAKKRYECPQGDSNPWSPP